MKKKRKLIVFEEVNGQFIPKENRKQQEKQPFNVQSNEFLLSVVGLGSILTAPITASAANEAVDNVTGNIYSTLLTLFDTAVVFIIMFAGGAWALGHRSKAIHILICVCCGYFVARHAEDIRDFMRSI